MKLVTIRRSEERAGYKTRQDKSRQKKVREDKTREKRNEINIVTLSTFFNDTFLKILNLKYTVSVLGRDEGYTVKYNP